MRPLLRVRPLQLATLAGLLLVPRLTAAQPDMAFAPTGAWAGCWVLATQPPLAGEDEGRVRPFDRDVGRAPVAESRPATDPSFDVIRCITQEREGRLHWRDFPRPRGDAPLTLATPRQADFVLEALDRPLASAPRGPGGDLVVPGPGRCIERGGYRSVAPRVVAYTILTDCGRVGQGTRTGLWTLADGGLLQEIERADLGDGTPMTRARQFQRAPQSLWPQELLAQLDPRALLMLGARQSPVTPSLALTRDLHTAVGPDLTALWLLSRGEGLQLSGAELEQLERDGVGTPVLDALVALDHPDRFVLGLSSEARATRERALIQRRVDPRDRDPWAWGAVPVGPWGWSPFWDPYWSPWGPMWGGGWGWNAWGPGWIPGRGILVVPRRGWQPGPGWGGGRPGTGSGGDYRPGRGRVDPDRGYQPPGGSRPSGPPPGSSSGGGSAGSSGGSGSGSSASGKRPAVSRPPGGI